MSRLLPGLLHLSSDGPGEPRTAGSAGGRRGAFVSTVLRAQAAGAFLEVGAHSPPSSASPGPLRQSSSSPRIPGQTTGVLRRLCRPPPRRSSRSSGFCTGRWAGLGGRGQLGFAARSPDPPPACPPPLPAPTSPLPVFPRIVLWGPPPRPTATLPRGPGRGRSLTPSPQTLSEHTQLPRSRVKGGGCRAERWLSLHSPLKRQPPLLTPNWNCWLQEQR